MPNIKCDNCGNEFYKTQSQVNVTNNYCCRKCADLARRKRVNKKCNNCGDEFEVWECRDDDARFCSLKCYREFIYVDHTYTCCNCGKKFKKYRADNGEKYNRVFCSNECVKDGLEIYPKTKEIRDSISRYRSHTKSRISNQTKIKREDVPKSLIDTYWALHKLKLKVKQNG